MREAQIPLCQANILKRVDLNFIGAREQDEGNLSRMTDTSKQLADLTPPPQEMTVLIADDHWVVRESLKQVTKSLGSRYRSLEASNFHEALQALSDTPEIGLVLVDLIMPGFNEFDGLGLLRLKFPTVPFVVISIHEDPEYVLKAISYGVVGYIPKSANATEIKRALIRVISGEVAFPREILSRVTSGSSHTSFGHSDKRLTSIQELTARERKILSYLGGGMSLATISDTLIISRQTVRVHLGNAMKKLSLTTRESAIRFAVENVELLRKET